MTRPVPPGRSASVTTSRPLLSRRERYTSPPSTAQSNPCLAVCRPVRSRPVPIPSASPTVFPPGAVSLPLRIVPISRFSRLPLVGLTPIRTMGVPPLVAVLRVSLPIGIRALAVGLPVRV